MTLINFKEQLKVTTLALISTGCWTLITAKEVTNDMLLSFKESPGDAIKNLNLWKSYVANQNNWPLIPNPLAIKINQIKLVRL